MARDSAEQHLLDENDALRAEIVALKHALVETMAAAWPCAAQRFAGNRGLWDLRRRAGP